MQSRDVRHTSISRLKNTGNDIDFPVIEYGFRAVRQQERVMWLRGCGEDIKVSPEKRICSAFCLTEDDPPYIIIGLSEYAGTVEG
jgi:hypothetical protein